MQRYTIEQRFIIVKTHYQNGENYTLTHRKVCALFGRENAPNRTTIIKLIEKFEKVFTLMDQTTGVLPRPVGSMANIAAVNKSVADSDMADTEVKRRGRPKKKEVAEPVLKRAAVSNGDDTVPAKRGRGRPPKAGGGAAAKKAIVPSGRGRGRPATKQQTPSKKKKKESEDEEDNEDEEEKKDSSSVEAEDSS